MIRRQQPVYQLALCDSTGSLVAGDSALDDSAMLLGVALALGASDVRGWSQPEERLAQRAIPSPPRTLIAQVREQIAAGEDPLGDAFCRIFSAAERRDRGATYTPAPIVKAMIDGAAERASPDRVIDPGLGSGRFLVAAGRCFRGATLVGIELDPFAAILGRAHLAAAGLADRSAVLVGDYRDASNRPISGRSLYLGNPPYVRHHQIEPRRKQWLSATAASLGLRASQLAGLHVHFFMATAKRAAAGDAGSFVTSAEWLDVNYGSVVRALFLGPLGGRRLTIVEPKALPFPDAATTAVIAEFEVGSTPRSIDVGVVSCVDELDCPHDRRTVARSMMRAETRWSRIARPARGHSRDHIELGELFRVHRGQVTGDNKTWIAGPHSVELPESVQFPSVTKARELFAAGPILKTAARLRCVIDLPRDLDQLDREDRDAVERFLKWARSRGADAGYIATNRKAWWSVGLRQPAPILATYMARRPPAFVYNAASARHINIAHGLYPRNPIKSSVLMRLARHLSQAVSTADGRTYAGGLTKFEPREMERLLIPRLEALTEAAT